VKRLALSGLLLAAAIAALPVTVSAQTNPNLEIGIKPYGSYDVNDFDTVSIANGNLFLHIPFLSYPQRGSTTENLYIVSNSKNFSVFQWCNSVQDTCQSKWTWTGGLGITNTNAVGFRDLEIKGPPAQTWWTAFTWDGSSHDMGIRSDGTYESLDGSGIRYNSTTGLSTVRNGNLATNQEDTNGNTWTGNVDTLGRSSPSSSTATTDYTGCTGPLPTEQASIFDYPGISAGSLQVKICYADGTVNTGFGASNNDPYDNIDPIQELKATELFLQTIIVYNGSSWTTSPAWSFTYDAGPTGDTSTHYGDLLTVTLPTGGTISYTWQTVNLCEGGLGLIPVSRAVTSRTINANDGLGPLTTQTGSITTDPMGNDTVHVLTGLNGSCSLYETETDYYQGSHTGGTLLKTVKTVYQFQNDPLDLIGDGTPLVTNVFPNQITTIWPNGMESQVQKNYDANLSVTAPGGGYTMSYGNPTEVREYDYGTTTPLPLLRRTDYTYLAFNTASYLTAHMLDRVASETVYNGSSTQVAQTTYGYDESGVQTSGAPQHGAPPNSVRGNQTSVNRWLSTTGTTLKTTTTYYDTGMPYQVTDPNLNVTTYSYSSTYDNAYLTETQFPTTGSGVAHTVSAAYDFNTGKITQFTDQNGQPSNYTYDVLFRPSTAVFPDTGGWTFNYPDLLTVELLKKIDGTRTTDFYLHSDGLGREIRHITANDEGTPWDQVDTCYNDDGQKSFVSYPYQGTGLTEAKVCSGAGDSFAYDGMGRIKSLTHSDGTAVTTTYTGRATMVTDEGNGTRGVQRVSQADGLGRLASECEVSSTTLAVGLSPTPAACGQDIAETGFLTTYAYDALGDLTGVTQPGLNPRSFTYDSLARLLTSANPESGTVTYTYDADGNLLAKKDARSITTTYTYDALNRMLTKSYSDGTTPAVTLNYDETSALGATGLKYTTGRASSSYVTSGSTKLAGEVFSYDQMGRAKVNSQCTPQNCGASALFPVSYTYDLVGDTATATNGMAVTLTSTVNRATRLTSLASSLVGTGHPGTLLSAVHYNASAGVVSATMGNSISETRTYDGRLRLNTITDGSAYSVTIPSSGGYAPDGDILAANDSANANWSYLYDDFNRLTKATPSGQSWFYTYAYDRYGNRWQQTLNGTGGSGPTSSLTFDANNHIASGNSVTYDAAGNVTGDPTNTYVYDAENRITSTTNTHTGVVSSYVYDASGQRVRKTSGGVSLDYIYDLAGRVVAEVNSTGGWNRGEVFAGGRHLATYSGGTGGTTYFIHGDWLGTERARTTVAGAVYETCTSLPFGDNLQCSASDPSPLHFTGKQRDSESNLDNFGARYNSSSIGRFISADPMGNYFADPSNPQGWNMYIYVRNNPLNFTDPTGLDCVYLAGASDNPNPHGNGSATVVQGDCINAGGKNDSGVFVDNDENHPVQSSDVTLNSGGSLGLISYTRTDGLTTGHACIGNCPSDTVQVNAAPPGTPTMSAPGSGIGLRYPTISPATMPPTDPFKFYTVRPPSNSIWVRMASNAGCTGNDALSNSSQESTDTPAGHMNGQRAAQSPGGPLLNPTGGGSSEADTVVGALDTFNKTEGCLAATNP
jgi:RHS repeat-associated protein